MIYLITGVPGTGKTLYTIWQIVKRVEAENQKLVEEGREPRPVYYSGIPDLKLPWIELADATKWNECPIGSIIVIDECQRVFRPRGTGTAVPAYIADLETHRHKGYDIYLPTQHPMLVDQNIRRLVGKHQHIVRKFGISAATVHEWGSTHEITKNNLASAQRVTWPYSKEVFGYYKSSELHTHKAKLPKRVWFLLASPFLIGALAYGAYKQVTAVHEVQVKPAESAQVSGSQPGQGANGQAVKVAAKLDYFEASNPRLPGLYHTAPKYDDITKPTDAPWPMACVIVKPWRGNPEKCRCLDQQGNHYAATEGQCRSIAINGIFKDWGDNGKPPELESKRETIPAKPVPVQSVQAAPVEQPAS